MKLQRSTLLKRLLLLSGVALLVTLFYPHGVRFMYEYALDQPWRYEGVLTAPYDFVVYKSSAQLAAERDSVERSKIYFFALDEQKGEEAAQALASAYAENKMPEKVTLNEYQYVQQALEQMYQRGILLGEDMELLQGTTESKLYVIGADNVAKRRDSGEIATSKIVYEQIIANAPSNVNVEALKSMKLERFLYANLTFDSRKTAQMHEARLASITEEVGRVQKGERIVGTGDVVTADIYQALEGYRTAHEKMGGSSQERWWLGAGRFLLIFMIFGVLFLYLLVFAPNVLRRQKDQVFLLAQVAFFAILSYLLVPIEPVVIYVLPYSMVMMLVRIFMTTRTAFVTHMVTILLALLVAPSPMEFVLVQLIAGGVVQVTLSTLSQRSDLVRSSFAVFFSMFVVTLSYYLALNGSLSGFNWNIPIYLSLNFIFLMFTYVLIYLFERTFGYTSSISLVELSDINKPLLRQLSEVAPGTFQHSLNVSILASEAVDRIGGDVRLVRSGALYHDIGKMKNPTYFTENQGNNNPHDKLSCIESAKVIIKHVTDGVEMAQRAKLPEVVIDFIRTHHGLGMTKYFYVQYANEHPDEVVDKTLFYYPGPNPFTREQGVLMLADAVEASSRSLKELTEEKIIAHTTKIVDGIVEEGLLKDTPLTFRDIETIKQVFIEKLRTMYHSRIEYPELVARTEQK